MEERIVEILDIAFTCLTSKGEVVNFTWADLESFRPQEVTLDSSEEELVITIKKVK